MVTWMGLRHKCIVNRCAWRIAAFPCLFTIYTNSWIHFLDILYLFEFFHLNVRWKSPIRSSHFCGVRFLAAQALRRLKLSTAQFYFLVRSPFLFFNFSFLKLPFAFAWTLCVMLNKTSKLRCIFSLLFLLPGRFCQLLVIFQGDFFFANSGRRNYTIFRLMEASLFVFTEMFLEIVFFADKLLLKLAVAFEIVKLQFCTPSYF